MTFPKATGALTIRAGPRALAAIRADGLRAADIALVPGAAGGPKALGLHGLDVALFGEWFPKAPRVRHLVGASIGAWRFAAACRPDPAQGLRELARLYAEERYPPRPGAALVTRKVREMLAALFDGHENAILAHRDYRLHILAVRGRGLLTRDAGMRLTVGFGAAAFANLAGRRHLRHFLERTVFHDARGRPPFLDDAALSGDLVPASGAAPIRFDAFHTHAVALGRDNLREALVASAAIPMLIHAVPDIPGAPAGVYWDGGLIDYHLHLPYSRSEALVLYPHFTDRIVPGWLDKALPWRRARGEWLDNVILVSPSREYVASLPFGKLPDRKDFKRFESDFDGRLACWRRAIAESARLGDEFLAFAERPDPSRVLPL
ncbi:MAG: patatin-like phospholipase family protein [Betaproteobacteria bacterium]|nr:patatin-like phospholipase family protein [Betaproteobacteria bacterium]